MTAQSAPAMVIGWEPATGRRWYRRPSAPGRVPQAETVRRLKTWGEFWRRVEAGEIVLGAPPRRS